MLDTIIIFSYLSILLLMGIISSRKIKSFRDYALGHKSYSWLVITATLSASFLGGGFTMGISSNVYLGGIIAIIGIFGFSLKEIIVAKFFAKRFERFPDALSIGDIMESQYGRPAKLVSGILGLIVCSGIVGVQLNALGYISHEFFGISQHTALIIGGVLLTAYTVLGGLSAIILTDVLQFWILVIGIPLTCIFGLIQVGGWSELMAAVPSTHVAISSDMIIPTILLFLTFLFGETFVPPYIQRLMIGEHTKDVERGTLMSGLLSIPVFVLSGLIGLLAFALFPGINAESVLPTLINAVLPIGLKGIVVVGVLSAVMSTADSFLQAGAVSFVHDVLKPLKQVETPKKELFVFRSTTVIMGGLAIVAAIMVKELIDLCLYAWTFWSPVMLVPFAAVLLGLNGSKNLFYLSSVSAAAIALITSPSLGGNALLAGVLTSFIVFSGGYYFAKR